MIGKDYEPVTTPDPSPRQSRNNRLVLKSVENWEKVRKIQVMFRYLNFARASVYINMVNEQYRKLEDKKIDDLKKETVKVSKPKFFFDLLVCLINLYLAFMVPFRLAFFHDYRVNKLYIHDLILDGILLSHIIFKLSTARKPDSYLYNLTKRKFIQHFMSLGLYTDILSIIPLYMLDSHWYWLKTTRIIRVNSIFAWILSSKIPKIVMKKVTHSQYETILTLFNMLQFSNYILIICHCIACLWFIIPNELSVSNELTWLGPDWETYSITDEYMRSLYWTTVTFSSVGYGDITGKTTEEYIYSMFVEFLGIMCFAYFMGSLTNSLTEYYSKKEKVEYRENELNRWLIWVEEQILDSSAQKEIDEKITKYFHQKWLCDPNSLNQGEDYLMMLPYTLSSRLNRSLFGPRISLFKSFFKNFPKHVRYLISGQLCSSSFPAKIEVVKSGSKNNKIYFINAGSVAVGSINTGYSLMLGSSSFFGEDSAIFEDFSLSSFVSRTETCVYYIEYPVLKKILLKNKTSILPFAKLAFKRAKYFDEVNNFRDARKEYVNDDEIREFCLEYNFEREFDMETEDLFWERAQGLKEFFIKKEKVSAVIEKKVVDEVRKASDKLDNELKELQKKYELEIKKAFKCIEQVKQNIA